MRRASQRGLRYALVALCVAVAALSAGLIVVLTNVPPDDPAAAAPTEGAQMVLGTAPSPSASPPPSPSPSPTTTPPAPTAAPPPPAPTGDQVGPVIGNAVPDRPGVWTNQWCSAGSTITRIEIPVEDATDPASSLQMVVQFVLRRSDNQATVDMGRFNVTSSNSPFIIDFGPYQGPNPAYAYDNVVDVIVTVRDQAGNTATRTFPSLFTVNDCKAGVQ